jgi:hypothetical protein
MDKGIIAYLGFGYKGEAHFTHYTAEINLAHGQVMGSINIDNFSGDTETHIILPFRE